MGRVRLGRRTGAPGLVGGPPPQRRHLGPGRRRRGRRGRTARRAGTGRPASRAVRAAAFLPGGGTGGRSTTGRRTSWNAVAGAGSRRGPATAEARCGDGDGGAGGRAIDAGAIGDIVVGGGPTGSSAMCLERQSSAAPAPGVDHALVAGAAGHALVPGGFPARQRRVPGQGLGPGRLPAAVPSTGVRNRRPEARPLDVNLLEMGRLPRLVEPDRRPSAGELPRGDVVGPAAALQRAARPAVQPHGLPGIRLACVRITIRSTSISLDSCSVSSARSRPMSARSSPSWPRSCRSDISAATSSRSAATRATSSRRPDRAAMSPRSSDTRATSSCRPDSAAMSPRSASSSYRIASSASRRSWCSSSSSYSPRAATSRSSSASKAWRSSARGPRRRPGRCRGGPRRTSPGRTPRPRRRRRPAGLRVVGEEDREGGEPGQREPAAWTRVRRAGGGGARGDVVVLARGHEPQRSGAGGSRTVRKSVGAPLSSAAATVTA